MNYIHYSIQSTEIKPFSYKTPLINVTTDGELNLIPSSQAPLHIKKITFLNLVGRDNKGNIVSYVPMDYVNNFIMSLHIDDSLQESEQYSKALIQYFTFIVELQKKWDEEFDVDQYDEFLDQPRPSWDYMALRKSERITYLYRKALIFAVINEKDQAKRIAKTTASAYMRAVIKFYSWHLRHGVIFNNPPFEHEVISLKFEAKGSSMKSYMTKDVHTTDLRLNFGSSKRNEGGYLQEARRDLSPLSNIEWLEVEKILRTTKRVIKNVKGNTQKVSISLEYCLFFLISRYSGMRKEEVASLHCDQIFSPDISRSFVRIGIGGDYGSLTKTNNGGINKSRLTILPTSIMMMLFHYTRSERYLKRLKKFKELCKSKLDDKIHGYFEGEDGVDESKNYLFLSQTGKPFFTKLSEVNARWDEIRNTVNDTLEIKMLSSPHNLRPTFAVNLFRALLKKVSVDVAISAVSKCLGHDDIKNTLLYLKIAQDLPNGDEIYEDVLDYLGLFDLSLIHI